MRRSSHSPGHAHASTWSTRASRRIVCEMCRNPPHGQHRALVSQECRSFSRERRERIAISVEERRGREERFVISERKRQQSRRGVVEHVTREPRGDARPVSVQRVVENDDTAVGQHRRG
eukprot:3327774-Prymnesium_polylepis.1